jgi:sRNA-binding carbon storage regulator CsrA
MELLELLVVLSIVIGYFNLWLIIKKEKPTIINNIYTDKETKNKSLSSDKDGVKSSVEVPIESSVSIKEIKGTVNLENEHVGKSDVSELADKIKKFRNI